MGDEYPKFIAAAVQAAPVFLDREATTEKAAQLIREAGHEGAHLIVFPEGFIPSHPLWFHYHPAAGTIAGQMNLDLFKNAVEVPGPQTDLLGDAARDAGAYVVIGVCEKLPHRMGTLFNTQVFIGPDGGYLGKHQKLMPTATERLVHSIGAADTFGIIETDFGPISGLICGENSNPLALFALAAEGTRVHAMSWPNHLHRIGQPMRLRATIASQSFAQMTKAYVVSACATIDEATIAALRLTQRDEDYLRDPASCGGSVIVGPSANVIAGPMGHEEGILYADVDLNLEVKAKLRADIAGHYNRPDVFQLHVARSGPRLYTRDEPQYTTLISGSQISVPQASTNYTPERG